MTPNAAPVSWIARWRQRLIKLPENIFFDLIRCYIGEIRSPFNKQELLQRLENFITRGDVKSRILSLLTFDDRKLLSTVKMIPGLSEEKLHELAAPDRSYLDFHIRVLNLEDRLLIWRENENAGIRLNPHLEQNLNPLLSDSLVLDEEESAATGDSVQADGVKQGSGRLAESVEAHEKEALPGSTSAETGRPWFDDVFLAAMFSFIQENQELFTSQDVIRKRTIQEFGQRFKGLRDRAGLAQEPEYAEILGLVLSAFKLLGLIRKENEVTQLDYERWLELASLSQERRLALMWSAALYPKTQDLYDSESRVAFFSQTRIADFAKALFSWIRRVEIGKPFNETALRTLWTVEIEQGFAIAGMDDAIGGNLLSQAARLGLFSQRGRLWTRNDWTSVIDKIDNGKIDEPQRVLNVEASLDVTLTGHAPLMDLLVLAACTSLQNFGLVSVYRLTQGAARTGFVKSIDDKGISSLLERLSGAAIPQSVRVSLTEWYKDFSSVRIIDGVVVIAEGRRRIEIEHSEEIRPYIMAKPSEGIYVLDRRAAMDWLPMLESIGVRTGLRVSDFSLPPVSVRFLPPLMSLDLNQLAFPSPEASHSLEHTKPWRAAQSASARNGETEDSSAKAEAFAPRQIIIDELKAKLDAMQLSDDHRQAFNERVRNGLILVPEQLNTNALKLEHSEARGLDYTGKIRIIEQAIKTRSDFLEVQTRGDDGDLDGTWRMLIWPQKLRQMGSDLVLIAQTVPEGRELSIMIGRVLSVKRVRGSIFG